MSHVPRTGNSNTRMITRLSKQLNHGLWTVMNYRKDVSMGTGTTTYYLIKASLEILSFRDWYQRGRPDYHVHGSQKGCKGHKERLLEAS